MTEGQEGGKPLGSVLWKAIFHPDRDLEDIINLRYLVVVEVL